MVDRFLVWLGTGVVTAGISAALVAGAGVATATDGDGSDGGGTSTSESSDPGGTETGADAGQTLGGDPEDNAEDNDGDKTGDGLAGPESTVGNGRTGEDVTGDGTTDEDATKEDAKDETTEEDLTGEDVAGTDGEAGEFVDVVEEPETGTESRSNDGQEIESQTLEQVQTVVDDFDSAATIAGDAVAKEDALVKSEPESGEDLTMVPLAAEFTDLTEQQEAPEFAAVAFSSPAAAQVTAIATANPLNIVLDIIGTVVFGLYGFVIQLFGGPPMLPPNSGVTVLSSRLRIDCGCAPGAGEEVPVDWYIPDVEAGEDPPERLIYLQHGFLAAAPWYSHTAATLAKQTNSIVVAPSITSNFLDYGQCWLGGAPMHQAMAGLFAEGNTALAESADAAGYNGAIPDRVVLMGHSLGGGAVSGIAGYMTENESADRLAGVVLLDGVGLNGQMVSDLDKVDESIPIYQLAAPKYMWNMFGSGTDALVQARPDADFYGVTLAGGSHVDTMRGGNPLIQFAQQLVSGFSQPQNVEVASMLMVGWVNDMFADSVVDPSADPDDLYPEIGQTLTIDTPAGPATLVALPNSLRRPYLLNFLEPFLAGSSGLFAIQPGCLRESTSTGAACAGTVAA